VANGLDGKVAIVTGASSGIGEATSEALAYLTQALAGIFSCGPWGER
jgi:NAD(P)-dependent dehydrogenase (short-subunit alcohol dehydrogenase family)